MIRMKRNLSRVSKMRARPSRAASAESSQPAIHMHTRVNRNSPPGDTRDQATFPCTTNILATLVPRDL